MDSDTTAHTAQLVADSGGSRWRVSWLPDRLLNRNQAITAMVLAETVSLLQEQGRTSVVDHQHPLWPALNAWAGELGLTGPEAVVRVSEPPPGPDVGGAR